MGVKNRRVIKEYPGVILRCSHLEPLDHKGMHPLVRVRDKNGRNEEKLQEID